MNPDRRPITRAVARTSEDLWASAGPFGELGQTDLVRLGPNSWAATGPLGEVGQVLDDARSYGRVVAEPAQPMGGGIVLVNFRVVQRREQPAARAEPARYSPRASGTRPATAHRKPAQEAEPPTAPARRRPLVPRWAWWTAAAMVPVGAVAGAVWWVWLHLDAIVAGATSALLTAGGFLAAIAVGRVLLGGGRSGTWKTD